jgi:hypothetical protein
MACLSKSYTGRLARRCEPEFAIGILRTARDDRSGARNGHYFSENSPRADSFRFITLASAHFNKQKAHRLLDRQAMPIRATAQIGLYGFAALAERDWRARCRLFARRT